MGKFIITESEKQRIRLLYENVTLPASSQFVKDIAKTLGVSENLMQAIDWSLYKPGSPGANTEIYNKLSGLFGLLKPALTTAMSNIKSNPSKQSQVLIYLNNYKTGGMTKEQIDFLNDAKKQLQTQQPNQNQQQNQTQQNQTKSDYELYKEKYGKTSQTQSQTLPIQVNPTTPTLYRI